MPCVAFATSRDLPHATPDDQLAVDALRRRGIAVEPVVWDDPAVAWSAFDQVVIRSTWDYHLKPDLYERWLRGFLATPEQLRNPPESVLANLDKRYLRVLAERGAPIIPTAWVDRGPQRPLRDLLQANDWDQVVIKPAVSASAHGTWRTTLAKADSDEPRFAAQAMASDLLIQPFIPEIATRGEWSLVFIDGDFCHAVIKLPAGGDFRVQGEYGGRSIAATPTPELIAQAAAILALVDGADHRPILYARIDGVETADGFRLMELEINEPALYFKHSKDAAERFAAAIAGSIELRRLVVRVAMPARRLAA